MTVVQVAHYDARSTVLEMGVFHTRSSRSGAHKKSVPIHER